MHFEKAPLKLIRARAQYLYGDGGEEYLDCVNCVAHVGHCHPDVVRIIFNFWFFYVEHVKFIPIIFTVLNILTEIDFQVNAGKEAMLRMGTVNFGENRAASEYIAKLKSTLPKELDTFLFVSSGYVHCLYSGDMPAAKIFCNHTNHSTYCVKLYYCHFLPNHIILSH